MPTSSASLGSKLSLELSFLCHGQHPDSKHNFVPTMHLFSLGPRLCWTFLSLCCSAVTTSLCHSRALLMRPAM